MISVKVCVALMCAFLITGCSQNSASEWQDISGQARGPDEMQADNVACYKADMPADVGKASQAQLQEAFSRIDVCMLQHGWQRPK